jgi:hypothetical protein
MAGHRRGAQPRLTASGARWAKQPFDLIHADSVTAQGMTVGNLVLKRV